MFKFEVNEDVILRQQQAIEAALSTDPDMEKVLREIIRQAITEARTEALSNMHLQNDPRHAIQSLRRVVYKKILGANLNILERKRGQGRLTSTYEPPRTLRPGQRGGNRVKRSERTQQMMSYGPVDRGMILRWLNDGVPRPRKAGTRSGKMHGNRGTLTGKNFFHNPAEQALHNMADRMAKTIEDELARVINSEQE